MTHAQSYSPCVPMTARKSPAFLSPIVDRATALALRRTTSAGLCGKKQGRSTPIPSLLSSPAIHNLPATKGASSPQVPVVIVPVAPRRDALAARHQSLLARLGVDLSWIAALFIALGVTLALAIPLELFRQNG